jgi:hypothetical protein
MKQLALLVLFSLLICGTFAMAQEQPAAKPTAEEIEKQKEEWTKNAYRMLDQVIDESQSLRLIENRIRIQINAADMLWDKDQGRARSMFMLAGDSVAEMLRAPETNPRFAPNQIRRPSQLRQELVLSAARHDAQLAYQLLATTKPAVQPQNTDSRQPRPLLNAEDNIEQTLLAAVSALDPKLAAQNADQLLEKGQFPLSVSDVITQLRKQDPEAAAKLADKTVKRLQSANILSNSEAGMLALGLLNSGPRVSSSTDSEKETPPPSGGRGPVLDTSGYVDLLGTVIDFALKAAPPTQNTPRAANPRGGGGGMGNVRVVAPNQSQPTDAQIEQGNARRMLSGLQRLLPQIDQNLPGRAQAVRQKLTEVGLGNNNQRAALGQTLNSLQRGDVTADSLMQVAASAPPQMQSRLYQQAAFKALEEGNTDRARQIATDHLDTRLRDSVMQRIDFRELASKAEGTRIDEVRQSLARLQSDNERVELLIQLATDVAPKNPKLQRQLLEEARQMTNKRATNYEHFEQQLRVAHAFAEVDPARSFEVLDPGISHLNELLAAAALLSGFETNVFRDGELPLQGGSSLTNMVNRFGQEIAVLAKTDFERSETLAGRFQFPESRIMARLAIVQGLLGVRTRQANTDVFRIGETFIFSNTRP